MADPKKPNDGGGVKWSTLKRKIRKVKLENGEEIEVPVTWNAFNNSVTYVGYEVELDKEVTIGGNKVSKIQVWVLVSATASPPGAVDYRGWCHGLTFDDIIYSPGGDAVPAILAAGWDEIDCKNSAKGDIIVYFNAAGGVTHTATSNGDGTYNSKGGANPQNNKETEAAMDKAYNVPPGTKKCYRKKP